MNLWKAISSGFRHYRLAFFLYLFNLGFGLFLGSQFFSIFKSGRADDWRHLGWQGQWDHALVQDFFANEWNALQVIQFEVLILIPIFIMVNVFVTAGVFHAGRLKNVEWIDFWEGGSKLFFPFLLNFLFYFILITLLAGVTIIPVSGWSLSFIQNQGTEIGAFRVFMTALVVFIVGLSFLVNSSSVSKALIEREGLNPWKALIKGLIFAMKKIGTLSFYFFFFLILAAGLLYLVTALVNAIGFGGWSMLLLIVIFQQFFIFMRSLLRIMYLFSVQNLVIDSTK